jgi:hypothetical protein
MLLALLLLLLAYPSALLAQDGRLERIRDSVRDEPVKREQPEKKEKKDDCDNSSWLWELLFGSDDDCHDDCDRGSSIGWCLVPFIAPYWLPAAACGDGWEEFPPLPKYPYAKACDSWSVRLAIEESHDFDRLNRVTAHLLAEHLSRLGIQASWSWLHEELPRRRTDDLFLGDVNLVLRFAQSNWGQFRSGIGFRWLADDRDTDFGFNFTYGADFYPVKPLVLSTQLDLGTLGEASVVHLRGTLGVNLERVELYGGYDFLKIGGVEVQGPVVGLRFWF